MMTLALGRNSCKMPGRRYARTCGTVIWLSAMGRRKLPFCWHAPPVLTAGIAEAKLDALFDAADIATEVINRVEDALEQAKSAETGAAFALAYSAPTLRLA